MPQGKWFRIGYGIIVILLIAYLAKRVDYLFNPIGAVFAALFIPVLVSGMFYYILRPPVRLLSKWLPLSLSIVIVYLVMLGFMYLFSWLIWPPIRVQSMNLVENFPDIVETVRQWLLNLQKHEWVRSISTDETFSSQNLASQLSTTLGDVLNSVVGSVRSLINIMMSFFLMLGLVPFIIYYMLSEGDKFPSAVLKLVPSHLREETHAAMKEIDLSMGSFIMGKLITSLVMGTLAFIGYLIIDLPYPLLLGLIAAITNVIPYLGPVFASVPAIIVALTVSPIDAVWVCVVIVVANQIESNIVSPRIMGKQLKVHPLTIMLLVLGVGAIIGPLGMIIVVPLYAILKIIVIRIYQFNKNNRIPKQPDLLSPPRK
ncbi:AI-2E family transporter [Cohnella endophytica]|nr:AI-2E family transporter [Cohnella endophytica]